MKIIASSHYSYLLLVLMACSTVFSTFSHAQESSYLSLEKPRTDQEVWLNIFVHGIISIKPHITVSNFVRFLSDNVFDSIYAETVDIMRDDPFFFQNQAIQARGLCPINLDNHSKGAAASALAMLYSMTGQINSCTATKNYFYTYGWTGLLSRSARYTDAKEFLFSLEKEVAQFKAKGINPKIRLLGYSHGGTIVIKLGMVKQKENLQPNFSIDEAFLFGTPIQFDTDYYINDPLFKKVYNIFSRGDRVQKLDFFSCGEFFSERVFKSRCDFTVPDKVVQIEIRIIRKKGEQCKPLCPITEQCPPLFNGKRCSRNFRNVSPGHAELWFLGWTPMHYRPTFPLYPLPIVVFMPFIINSLKCQNLNFKSEIPISITIDPYRNSMIVNNNLANKQIFTIPFVGIENLIKLKEIALSYKPDPSLFNKEKYDEHITAAYDKAVIVLRDKKCQQKIEAKIASCD